MDKIQIRGLFDLGLAGACFYWFLHNPFDDGLFSMLLPIICAAVLLIMAGERLQGNEPSVLGAIFGAWTDKTPTQPHQHKGGPTLDAYERTQLYDVMREINKYNKNQH